jgi:spermidine synthase
MKMKHTLLKSFQKKASAFEEIYLASKGKPFFFDSDDMRTLHFDARFIQSAMRLSAPYELLLSYTRGMMAFLLFNRQPKSILMIGLGGGSLAKYCYRILPDTNITVLEIDDNVIALRESFAVPPDSERFVVLHTDAKDYIATMEAKVDVILHDGFDANGLAPTLNTTSFYSSCRAALSENGILVSNLWGDAEDLAPSMERLWSAFDSRLWWSNATTSLNRVVCALNGDQDVVLAHLQKQAVVLDLLYELGFEELAERFQTGQGKTNAEFNAISEMNPVNTLMLAENGSKERY